MPFFGHKTRREREWEEVRALAQEDLVALGDDIRSLDVDVEMPNASTEAKQRYEQAVEAYQRASGIFDKATRPEDLGPGERDAGGGPLRDGVREGVARGPPAAGAPRPCFFDPRHGPSTEDVEWAPPDGAPRPVPACAADALRIREGFGPHSRQVLVNGRPTDYWNAPRHYGPWAGGYFNGFGGGGLLLRRSWSARRSARGWALAPACSATCSATAMAGAGTTTAGAGAAGTTAAAGAGAATWAATSDSDPASWTTGSPRRAPA